MRTQRIDLPQCELPCRWYNIVPDLPRPTDPPLHPATGGPIGPADLAPIFPMGLLQQEMSAEPFIEIPDDVREVYKYYRPTPIFRAHNLEKALDTPAHIYYKYEGASPAGSHKPNTAIAQAFYNKEEGIKRLATETGAGQWGCALSMASSVFGLKCTVYMVRISFEHKPYRRVMMETWGGECFPSPSNRSETGRRVLAENPDTPGSLAIAISEAMEDCMQHDDTHYALGSVLNHVMLHQTIIGEEALKQMELAGEYPDIVIGCHGGGSNFAGMSFPFAGRKLRDGLATRIIAAEPQASPTLTRGTYGYDFGDLSGMTPVLHMHTLGHGFVPAPIHAGGLRYHGAAPLVSLLLDEGVIEAQAFHQNECYEAALLFARTENWIPAPETSHAIRCAVAEAQKCKQTGEAKTILFNFSGHGLLDLTGYDKFMHGELADTALPDADLRKGLATLPDLSAMRAGTSPDKP